MYADAGLTHLRDGSIFFGLLTVSLITMGYYLYGSIPGVAFLVAVLFLLKKASNK